MAGFAQLQTEWLTGDDITGFRGQHNETHPPKAGVFYLKAVS